MHITIPTRYNGPIASGNGGYVAGRLAEGFALLQAQSGRAKAEPISGEAPIISVALKAPPPLDEALWLQEAEDQKGLYTLLRGETLIATVEAEAGKSLIAPPSGFEAGFSENNIWSLETDETRTVQEGPQSFGHCFVCGQERAHGDGLRLKTKAIRPCSGPKNRAEPTKNNQIAAPGQTGTAQADLFMADFPVFDDLFDAAGFLRRRYIFASLDCPGYFAVGGGEAALLARMSVAEMGHFTRPLQGEKRVLRVLSWAGDRSGRKRLAGTALFAPDGRLIARAESLWVTVSADYLKKIAEAT